MRKIKFLILVLISFIFAGQALTQDIITLAVGYGGRRMITSDGGKTWTDDIAWVEKGGDDDNLLRGVCYGDGKFVAVGGSKIAPIVVSENGADWTELKLEGGWIGDVAFGNNWFVAVGGGGSYLRSKDGLKWEPRGINSEINPGYPRHYRKIAFGNGVFIAVGDKGRRTLTTDGITWTDDQPINEKLKRQNILFANRRFIIIGSEGYLISSTDGKAWTKPESITSEDLRSILWDGKKFIISAESSLLISPDGQNWKHIPAKKGLPATIHFDPAARTYFGFSWRSRFWTSVDGLNWERNDDSGKNAITSIISSTLPIP